MMLEPFEIQFLPFRGQILSAYLPWRISNENRIRPFLQIQFFFHFSIKYLFFSSPQFDSPYLFTSSFKLGRSTIFCGSNRRRISTMASVQECKVPPVIYHPISPTSKLFVTTCAPTRDINGSYVAWGHSTVVGAFGEIIAATEHDEAVVIADINYSQLDLRRAHLSPGKQRRGDLYQLVDVQRLSLN